MVATSKASQVFEKFLRPYQRAWVEDQSPRKICLKSRRIGMSEAILVEALLLALRTPYHDVYLCSTSYTNAKELLRRLERWVEAFSMVGCPLPVVRHTATVLEFKNHSRILPLPAKAVRSRTGTVILDEFAFWQHDRSIWAGIAPVADTDPSMRIVIISTPFGASGMFHEIWNDPDGEHGEWSRHEIDIYEAASQGFPVNPDAIKAKYPSDIWLQEFCCQFLSDINQYFGHDLIRKSQYSDEELPDAANIDHEWVAGIDLASVSDGSVFSPALDQILTRNPRLPRAKARCLWHLLPHTLKRAGESRDYTPQFEEASSLMTLESYGRVAVDATGEGAGLAQDLRRKYGAAVVDEVKNWKEVYAKIPDMKLAMEQGHMRIPHDPKLRAAFCKVQRTITSNNAPKFEAKRDSSGHADEFFGALLAWHAARPTEEPKDDRGGVVKTKHKSRASRLQKFA